MAKVRVDVENMINKWMVDEGNKRGLVWKDVGELVSERPALKFSCSFHPPFICFLKSMEISKGAPG